MFRVTQTVTTNPGPIIRDVYSVRTNHGEIQFLIYDKKCGQWLWVDSRFYMPAILDIPVKKKKKKR